MRLLRLPCLIAWAVNLLSLACTRRRFFPDSADPVRACSATLADTGRASPSTVRATILKRRERSKTSEPHWPLSLRVAHQMT